jgi:hypothetical protein
VGAIETVHAIAFRDILRIGPAPFWSERQWKAGYRSVSAERADRDLQRKVYVLITGSHRFE